MCWTLTHQTRLLISALSVASGTGFLIYSTYVTNNLQLVGESWINRTYFERYNVPASPHQINLFWACVIAAKEVGKIIGTLLLPFIAEKSGRRSGLLINNVIVVIGCLLCLYGDNLNVWVIMAGRLMLGISMICGVGLASLYLIEIAPMKYRGWSGSLIQVFRGLGGTLGMTLALPQLMGNDKWYETSCSSIGNDYLRWGYCMAIPAIPSIVQFMILLFCTESPRHLYITEAKEQAAVESIRFYQGNADLKSTMDDLRRERERIETTQGGASNNQTWGDMYAQTIQMWRPISLTTLALTNRSLAGILLIQSYSTDMFIMAGLTHAQAAYCTVMLGICHFISAILVTFTVERWGRKPMLVWSNIACCITLIIVAVLTIFAHLLPFAPQLTVLSLSIFMFVYPVVASVSNIVASEICHQKIRSIAFTIGLLCYSIVGFISTFAYPLLKHKFGVAGSFLPFIIALALTIFIYHRYLPETRGKTFESLAFSHANVTALDLHEPLLNNENCSNDHSVDDLDFDDNFTTIHLSDSVQPQLTYKNSHIGAMNVAHNSGVLSFR